MTKLIKKMRIFYSKRLYQLRSLNFKNKDRDREAVKKIGLQETKKDKLSNETGIKSKYIEKIQALKAIRNRRTIIDPDLI